MEWRYGQIDVPRRQTTALCFAIDVPVSGARNLFPGSIFVECWRRDPCYVVPLLHDRLAPDLPERTAQFMK